MIDKLIAAAPDVPPPAFDIGAYWKLYKTPKCYRTQAREELFEPYHTAPKVTIGTYDILNNKTSLRAFKKAQRRKRHTPIPIRTPKPPTRLQHKRVIDFDGDYSRTYTPCKVTKLIERDPSRLTAGLYFDGFWTNGHYMVRIDKPKTKRPLEPATQNHHNFLKDALTGLELAAIGPEIYNSCGGVIPVVKVGKVRIRAAYLDIIMKYYPNATPWMKPGADAVYFLTDGRLVGVVMAII